MGVCLGYGYADGDPEGADEAEGGEVGDEQRLLDPGLPELQTHAERDHKLVTRDGCNMRFFLMGVSVLYLHIIVILMLQYP